MAKRPFTFQDIVTQLYPSLEGATVLVKMPLKHSKGYIEFEGTLEIHNHEIGLSDAITLQTKGNSIDDFMMLTEFPQVNFAPCCITRITLSEYKPGWIIIL